MITGEIVKDSLRYPFRIEEIFDFRNYHIDL